MFRVGDDRRPKPSEFTPTGAGFGKTSTAAVVLSLAAAFVLGLPTTASAASITCRVNGVSVTSDVIDDNGGSALIECPSIPKGVTIGGRGGNGNDGDITGAGDIKVVGGKGWYAGVGSDADGGDGGYGNNGTLTTISVPDGTNDVTVISGDGEHGKNSGEGGNGGHGNHSALTVTGELAVTGGTGAPAGPEGSEGGNGGDGNNKKIAVVEGPANLLGGDGGEGKPGGKGGLGNNGTVQGPFKATDGKSGPTDDDE